MSMTIGTAAIDRQLILSFMMIVAANHIDTFLAGAYY